MNDRELLKAAAKAAGKHANQWAELGELLALKGGWVQYVGHMHASIWNPLTDDGDALRLAVKLGIGLGIDMRDEIVTAYAPNPSPQHFAEDAHEVDHYAAVRRAIVRAAAALAPRV